MKIIISAFRASNDVDTNAVNSALLRFTFDSRHGLGSEPVTGYWEGQQEQSFIIHGADNAAFKTAIELALQFEQDAILVVNDDNRAMLVTLRHALQTYTTQDIGDFQRVSPAVAAQFPGYTVDALGRHFVACTRAARHTAERAALSTLTAAQCEAVAYA